MRLPAYYLPPAIANHDIAVRTLTYLILDAFDHLENPLWDMHEIFLNKNACKDFFQFVGKFEIGIFFFYAWRDWIPHPSDNSRSESDKLYTLLHQFFKKRFGQLCENVRVPLSATLKLEEGVDSEHLYILALLLFAVDESMVWVLRRILNDYPEMGRLNLCESTSPLIIGVKNTRMDVVEILIEAGAVLDDTDEEDRKSVV